MVGAWADRVAVITGGEHGIGRAVARLGAEAGGTVWSLDIAPPAGAAPGGSIRSRSVDVTDEAAVTEAIADIERESGRIDILVNAASRDSGSDALTLSASEWDAVMDLDLRAPWVLCRLVLPGMLARRRGSIVNIGSLHALMTAETAFPYGAAKAGLAALTRSLCLDYGPHGIRANTVTPGWTSSERVVADLEALSEEERERIIRTQPLRRIATPEEIAAVVVFIASDAASIVTGANWIADGGLSARFA